MLASLSALASSPYVVAATKGLGWYINTNTYINKFLLQLQTHRAILHDGARVKMPEKSRCILASELKKYDVIILASSYAYVKIDDKYVITSYKIRKDKVRLSLFGGRSILKAEAHKYLYYGIFKPVESLLCGIENIRNARGFQNLDNFIEPVDKAPVTSHLASFASLYNSIEAICDVVNTVIMDLNIQFMDKNASFTIHDDDIPSLKL